MHFYNRNAIHNSLQLLGSPAKLIAKHSPLQSLIPRIILKQSLIHNLFKSLGHHKPILLCQRKELLRLGQQPRLVGSEDHQRDRPRLALEGHLHSLDQIPMLAMAIHHIRHDERIEHSITRREMVLQRLHGTPPFIPLHIQRSLPRQLRVIPHIPNQIRIRIISHHSAPGTQRRADDTRHARGGSNLEDGFVAHKVIGVFFEVVGTCSAGIP